MLAEHLNQIWRQGSGNWHDDPRVKALRNLSENARRKYYNRAIEAMQIEPRVGERYIKLSPEHKDAIIEITAALCLSGDIDADWSW